MKGLVVAKDQCKRSERYLRAKLDFPSYELHSKPYPLVDKQKHLYKER